MFSDPATLLNNSQAIKASTSTYVVRIVKIKILNECKLIINSYILNTFI